MYSLVGKIQGINKNCLKNLNVHKGFQSPMSPFDLELGGGLKTTIDPCISL